MNKRTVLYLALFSLLTYACGKDEDTTPANNLQTKGKTIELTNGYYNVDSEGVYRLMIGNGAFADSIGYAGNTGLTLWFNSPQSESLETGEYAFSNDVYSTDRGFDGYMYQYDNAFFEIDSGTVIVNTDNTNWTVTVNVRYNNIQKLNSVFNGTFEQLSEEQLPAD